jgi:hypothetical protein
MNFADFITHHGKRINKEHFIHLVQVAMIDGKVEKSELALLHKEGRKFGLTDPEIDTILNSEATHNYTPPYSLKDKFTELYNIAGIILADDVITDSERRMIKRYAVAAGFSDEIIVKLLALLFEGIQKGKDEDELFHDFKKRHLFKG